MTRDTDVRHVDATTAIEVACDALVAAGSDPHPARLQAEHLVEAELRGHPSHGLRRLPILVGRIRAGLLDPNAEPTFAWGASAALSVDGNLGFGPVVAYRTIDELLRRVAQTGVAVAALRRTHHLGMLAPYVERLGGRGCIGLALSSTEGLVHPWGGAGPLLGTNPLGASVPARDGGIVLDMSTGAVSAGKILDYAERGLPLPEGWAVDADGHPTTDADAATRGSISPFGGGKGYALGLTLGAIVGALTGTAYGPKVRGTLDASHIVTKGDVFVAIDVEAFGQPADSPELAAYLDLIRASGADGGAVDVPGDRARRARRSAEESGFDVTEDVWSTIVGLASEAGIGVKAGHRP
ncbi:Ldh family oxidoreductase [Microbacterium sp.]|uniref:Ldh family oxidoreductase n=1 Tax=Microbacterium sp. TaxID=51671 RepID=UPI002B69D783|nr:Ldh family oxidoreductase [Microbacterium sp.]HWL77892.1 Ldh family oxidoreductase [Microbacterium sp.]